MLGLRVLTGVIGVPVLVGLTLLGGWPYLLGVVLPVIIGSGELVGMFRAAGFRPLALPAVALSVCVVADAAVPGRQILTLALAIAAAATLAWLTRREDWSGAVVDWALTLTPALYVGALLQFFVPLREREDGVFWVLAVLVCTWFSDSAAFFVGRAIGRHKLAPRISPGKSVEGAVAGVAASAIVGLVAAAIGGYALPLLAGFGLVVGCCAVLGDLLESFVKRQCGVKDSGSIIPGHGGILDRMDSVLLAVAGGYLYVAATA